MAICDLDDTRVKSDLLFESVLRFAKRSSLSLLLLPLWFLRGRAHGKAQIAARVTLDPMALPYRKEVLSVIDLRRQAGNKIILASASNDRFLQSIANHFGFFDVACGSTDTVNLKSRHKLQWIEANIQEPFEYISDSAADVPIWEKSSHAILVNPSSAVQARIKSLGISHEMIFDGGSKFKSAFKQLRVHQWVKNALIAVPAAAAHKLFAADILREVLLGMASFSLLASLVYVINDLLDAENDRKHPTKKHRPFAAGHLSLKDGVVMAAVLAISGFSLALPLGGAFIAVMMTYLAVNLAYSLRLKEVMMLDVVILASFYTMRLMAGSAATNTPISHWLLTFSTFFFLSLAMVKRFTEMGRILNSTRTALHGRGYGAEDKIPVLVMGVATAMLSILVLALYFASADVTSLYANSQWLWTLAPLLLFWNGRIWLLANRGLIHDDPVVFAVKDISSWIVFAVGAALVMFAR